MNDESRRVVLKIMEVFLSIVICSLCLIGIAHLYYNNVYCEVRTPSEYNLHQSFDDNYSVGLYANINELSYFFNTTITGAIVFPMNYSYHCSFFNKYKYLYNYNKAYNLSNISINYSQIKIQ